MVIRASDFMSSGKWSRAELLAQVPKNKQLECSLEGCHWKRNGISIYCTHTRDT